MKQQSLQLAVILILLGAVIFLLSTRKPPEYYVGPSQGEIDAKEKELIRSEQRRVEEVFQVKQEKKADSLKNVQEQRKSNNHIRRLENTIVQLRANVSVHTPDSTARPILEEIIDTQEQVILLQQLRIHNDSLHIQSMYENFNKQLSLHATEVRYLNERLELKDSEIKRKDAIIKRKRVGGVVKVGIIAGLIVLMAL